VPTDAAADRYYLDAKQRLLSPERLEVDDGELRPGEIDVTSSGVSK
jgi:hypothetical protein